MTTTTGDESRRWRIQRLYLILAAGLLIALATWGATAALARDAQADAPAETPPNFKVAIVGDIGVNVNAEAVLNLVASEGADMALFVGDLGYGNETDPQRAIDWDAQVTAALGDDFPGFATIGNHDVGNWETYEQVLLKRLALIPDATCTGDYGVQATCTYQGLFFILSGIGTEPVTPDHEPHVSYLIDELAADDSVWRICAWHKNQIAMQLGTKWDAVGWEAYEACRAGRAIVVTGHEHSYSRTKTLNSTQDQAIDGLWPDSNALRVSNGSTAVFVSGLGGQSIRNQDRCLPSTPPYGCNGEWASIYTSNQGANYGSLFIDFHVNGDPRKASGYFKNIDGEVVDTFTITSSPAALPAPGDSDGDGCADADEIGSDEMLGGRRDYLNPWDYFNPTGDGQNRVDDILAVVSSYFLVSDDHDRSYVGPNAWNLGPPDGRVLVDDILHAVNSYFHDCAVAPTPTPTAATTATSTPTATTTATPTPTATTTATPTPTATP